MGEHYIEKCACGIIVSQCRCPEGFGETKSIRIVKCTHPNPPVTDAYTKEAVEWMNAPTGPMPNLTMTDARHAPNCVSLIDRECGVCTCGLPSQPREVLTQERVEYLCNEIDCNGNLPYIAELLLKHDAAQREHLRALADRLAEVARERDEAKNHSNCIMCRARKAEQQVARLRECLVEYMTLADKICYAEPEYTQYHTMKTKASHALRETGA